MYFEIYLNGLYFFVLNFAHDIIKKKKKLHIFRISTRNVPGVSGRRVLTGYPISCSVPDQCSLSALIIHLNEILTFSVKMYMYFSIQQDKYEVGKIQSFRYNSFC